MLLSCTEGEDQLQDPPHLAMLEIEELENQELLFTALASNFAKLAISEYGFIYGEGSQLNLSEDFVVQRFGKPSEQFSLSPIHYMERGKEYYVSAYVKAGSETYQSEPTPFVGKGLAAFALDHIEMPDPLYFGDTVRFFGKNVFPLIDKYLASINKVEAEVVEVEKDYFSILIPYMKLSNKVDDDYVFDFHVFADTKATVVQQKVNFREPVFEQGAIQKVDFGEWINIRGQYFGIDDIVPEVDGKSLGYGNVTQTDSSISIRINFNLSSDTPSIVLPIRGGNYMLEQFAQLNPSYLLPNQEYVGYGNQNFLIKGVNLNATNLLITDHAQFNVESEDLYVFASNGEIDLNYSKEFEISPRVSKLYLNNLGELGDNYVQVHLQDAVLGHSRIPTTMGFLTSKTSKAVGIGKNGFVFSEDKIVKIDIESRTFQQVKTLPASFVGYSTTFAQFAENKLIYVGYLSADGSLTRFVEYNPVTNSYVILPDVPSRAVRPAFVYSHGDFVYIEGGIGVKGVREADFVEESFKYNTKTKSWINLNRVFKNNEYSGPWHSFVYNGILMIGGGFAEPWDDGRAGMKVMSFNAQHETWEDFQFEDLGAMGDFEGFQFINGKFMNYSERYVTGLDLVSGKSFTVDNFPRNNISGMRFNTGFAANEKYYFISTGGILYEADPVYFLIDYYDI
ncbi:hypothetical protein SAMN04489724_3351 [Algoriphagus locisalis]|uniref:Kelch motif-containing protein n=2 Tax=Algoriphagus locisalis TaxID=305507 RepID=A0A1I7CRF8_9BACT|nr:hypothetical protein SAMN04489724_3351 [Algoriphagus locisalis]